MIATLVHLLLPLRRTNRQNLETERYSCAALHRAR
jgi:hypothetical protein